MPTIPPSITPLPAPPDPNDRASFNVRAYPWSVAQQTLATEVGAVATNVKANADEAVTAAGTATTKAGDAQTAATQAMGYAQIAINAPGTQATSTTSLALSTGTKVITLAQLGKIFPLGGRVYAASASNLSGRRMVGTVMANDPGTGLLTMSVVSAGDVTGSGTYADWTIANAGEGTALPATTVPDAGKVLGVTPAGLYGLLAQRGASGASVSGNTTLTVASAGVQRITPTGPGQWIQMADATTLTTGTGLHELSNVGGWDVEIRDSTGAALGYIPPGGRVSASLCSIATAAGEWEMHGASSFGTVVAEMGLPLSLGSATTGMLVGAITIDATRELLLLAGDARLYGVVWDAAASVFGTPVLIRAVGVGPRVRAIATGANQALVMSSNGTALEGVTLTFAGTAITVNTAATATLAGVLTSMVDLIAVAGQGWVLAYARDTAQDGIRAITVTGTTVAIGAESLTTGDSLVPMIYDLGGSKIIAVDATASTITINMRTVAGTTLTAGTGTTLSISFAGYVTRLLASGRLAVIYRGAGSVTMGAIVSVSGTVVSTTTVALSAAPASPTVCTVVGSQVLMCGGNGSGGSRINVLTDNAGTAVAGTELIRDLGGTGVEPVMVAADATSVTVHAAAAYTSATGEIARVGISGNNAVVLSARALTGANYADGGVSRPSAIKFFKDTLPAGVLRGSAVCVAGLEDTRNLLWVSRAGMPVLVPAQPLQALVGGHGGRRSASGNWEWSGVIAQTGLVVTLQKLKVA